MNVSVTITGLDSVHKMNVVLLDEKNYKLFMDELAEYTLSLARLNAPLAKEHRHDVILEQSGRVISNENSRIVTFSDVPHAWYMENGTPYFPVTGSESAPMARTSTGGKPCFHPFLRSAAYKAIHEIDKMLDKAIFDKLK